MNCMAYWWQPHIFVMIFRSSVLPMLWLIVLWPKKGFNTDHLQYIACPVHMRNTWQLVEAWKRPKYGATYNKFYHNIMYITLWRQLFDKGADLGIVYMNLKDVYQCWGADLKSLRNEWQQVWPRCWHLVGGMYVYRSFIWGLILSGENVPEQLTRIFELCGS